MNKKLKIYLIGAMRNKQIPRIAISLRKLGFDVFDDWHSPGKQTDEMWRKYEVRRGRSFKEALSGEHAKNVFSFDKYHLDRSDIAILVLPAGRSGHMELGYMAGRKKKTFILLQKKVNRFDIMYKFATDVVLTMNELKMACLKLK